MCNAKSLGATGRMVSLCPDGASVDIGDGARKFTSVGVARTATAMLAAATIAGDGWSDSQTSLALRIFRVIRCSPKSVIG